MNTHVLKIIIIHYKKNYHGGDEYGIYTAAYG